eukprot:3372695-Amphidinium_carterae.1
MSELLQASELHKPENGRVVAVANTCLHCEYSAKQTCIVSLVKALTESVAGEHYFLHGVYAPNQGKYALYNSAGVEDVSMDNFDEVATKDPSQ